MGKTKQPPQEPVKLIRSSEENLSIAVTEEEKKYRNKNGPDDVAEIKKEKLKCTVCAKSVADIVKRGAEPFVHMVLGVLVCKDCSSFYGDGYFSADEDGDDKYCRWCGQGGTLYICSTCSCAFCKKCIKQNLGRQDVKDLESDDWQCLVCNPKPLYECRTICWALQENASKLKKEETKDVDNLQTTSKSKRDRKSLNLGTVANENSSNSKKRKASDLEDEDVNIKSSKKRKNSESKDVNSQKRAESSSRKSRSSKGLESDTEVSIPDKRESRSKRRSVTHEDESSPVKKSSRNSKRQDNKNKVEDIVLSDNEDIVDDSPKKSLKKEKIKKNESSPKKQKKNVLDSKNEEKKNERTRRSNTSKNTNDSSFESPSKKVSVKKKPKKSTKQNKRNQSKQRKVEENESCTDGDEERSHNSESDNLSETQSREANTKIQSTKPSEKPIVSKLSIGDDADHNVIKGCEYVNAALKDVTELSVLITNHCERLCSKVVHSNDNVLKTFCKLKELMRMVTDNLETIEQGLDSKINKWKETASEKTQQQNVEDIESSKPIIEDKLNSEVLGESDNETNDRNDVSEKTDNNVENCESVEEKDKAIVKEDSKTNDVQEEESPHGKEEPITGSDDASVSKPLTQDSDLSEHKVDLEGNKDKENIQIHKDDEDADTNSDNKMQSDQSEGNSADVNPHVDSTESTSKEHFDPDELSGQATDKSIDLFENNSPEGCTVSENVCEDNDKIKNNDVEISEKSTLSENEGSNNAHLDSTLDEESMSEINTNDESKIIEKPNHTEQSGLVHTLESSITLDEESVSEINTNDESKIVEAPNHAEHSEIVHTLESSIENNVNEADVSNESSNVNAVIQEDDVLNPNSNNVSNLEVDLNKEEQCDELQNDLTVEKKDEKLVQQAEHSESASINEIEKETSSQDIETNKCLIRETEEQKNGIDDAVNKKDDTISENKLTEVIKEEKKEDIRSPKTAKDDHKTIVENHSESPRRPSGSAPHQGSQRWSEDRGRDDRGRDDRGRDDRGRDDRGRDRKQHRYSGDRWSGGNRPGSWGRFDDRRPNRGGWGWSR